MQKTARLSHLPRRQRLRSFWRERCVPFWQGIQPPAIALAWCGAGALGYAGFALHAAAHGENLSQADLFYLTIQLFLLQSGIVADPLPWQLEVARFLAPGIAGYTALQALGAILSKEVELVRRQFLRNHVVICGLGEKGWLLARGFHREGARVVVIQKDEESDLIAPCRDLGITVLIGDATDADTLRAARVAEAGHLFAVTSDDGANAQIAVSARAFVRGRSGHPLMCVVHIVDPQLGNLLKPLQLAAPATDGLRSPAEGRSPLGAGTAVRDTGVIPPTTFRLALFNVYEGGAQQMLGDVLSDTSADQDEPPHLLIIGIGQMGESLLVHAARTWWNQQPQAGRRLRITLVDREAAQIKEILSLRHPQMESSCRLDALTIDVRSPGFERGAFLFDSQGRCDLSGIYICLDDDALSLSTGLRLREKLRGHDVDIYMRLTHGEGLSTLLSESDPGAGESARLHPFPLLDRTCQPDLLLGVTLEVLARLLHERSMSDPGVRPWDQLSEQEKESVRLRADHIGAKLKAVGCGIGPLLNWQDDAFAFMPAEVERLAQMEHERSRVERRRDPHGVARPLLKPWAEEPEQARARIREEIRELPGLLRNAGFQIYRVSTN